MSNSRPRIPAFKLAAVCAIAATALVAAPDVALAATSGGAQVTPSASVAKASAPFTIGLSSSSVKPGARLTISGLAYARAGLNVTITSDAISSARELNGVPAVQTPALAEGIYHTAVRVAPATEPGVYSVALRFDNRQVGSAKLRVVAANSNAGGSTRLDQCSGIGFTVLHNDRVGGAQLPGGAYTVSSSNMDCGSASADFASLLAGGGKSPAGWITSSPVAGRATFSPRDSGLSFTVSKSR